MPPNEQKKESTEAYINPFYDMFNREMPILEQDYRLVLYNERVQHDLTILGEELETFRFSMNDVFTLKIIDLMKHGRPIESIIDLRKLSKLQYDSFKKTIIYKKNKNPCQIIKTVRLKTQLGIKIVIEFMMEEKCKSKWRFIVPKNKKPILHSVQFQGNQNVFSPKTFIQSKILKII